jgi:hypothetical protein
MSRFVSVFGPVLSVNEIASEKSIIPGEQLYKNDESTAKNTYF